MINSAGHVTHYMPAEILNSAHGGNDRYIHLFSVDFYDFFLRFFKHFLRLLFMVSALGQNDRYNRYISAFLPCCRIDRNGSVESLIASLT